MRPCALLVAYSSSLVDVALYGVPCSAPWLAVTTRVCNADCLFVQLESCRKPSYGLVTSSKVPAMASPCERMLHIDEPATERMVHFTSITVALLNDPWEFFRTCWWATF